MEEDHKEEIVEEEGDETPPTTTDEMEGRIRECQRDGEEEWEQKTEDERRKGEGGEPLP